MSRDEALGHPGGRRPSPVRPPRMQALSILPLFFKLAGRRVVIAGGNEPASWKAELLSAAGARVEVWDPAPCAELEALAADPPGGAIELRRSPWTAESNPFRHPNPQPIVREIVPFAEKCAHSPRRLARKSSAMHTARFMLAFFQQLFRIPLPER